MYLPSFNLENKVALVTGSSRGIGRAIAIGLAEAGADVALFARSKEDLQEVAGEIEKIGKKALPLVLDVTNQAEVEKSTKSIIEEFGKIDILVNNAGINIRKPAFEVTEEDWNKIVDVNMKSVFMISKTVGSYMKGNEASKIVNIASIDGHVGAMTGVVYGMTKAAVIHMTKVLAIEWSQHNINVNAIGPGYVKTQITAEKLERKEYMDYVMSRTPLKRIGSFEDMVGATVFLSSEASDFMTGQTLFVDGGMSVFSY